MKSYFHFMKAFTVGFFLIFAIFACKQHQHSSLQKQILPVQGGQIAYYQFGHGSPIVLITGYGATVSEWNNTFLTDLALTHEVVVFDNRGVGNSHFNSNSYTVDDLANDTAQLISGLHLQKPTVLGWSMGGIIAQVLAIKHHESVGQLILMGTKIAGRTAIPTAKNVNKDLTNTSGTDEQQFNRIMRILFPASVANEMAKTFVADMFKPQGKSEPKVQADILKKQKLILHYWNTANDMAKKLRQLSIPTLILTGSDDVIIPPQNAAVLAAAIPHAQLAELQNGGHAMMYQYPKKMVDIINTFISRN